MHRNEIIPECVDASNCVYAYGMKSSENRIIETSYSNEIKYKIEKAFRLLRKHLTIRVEAHGTQIHTVCPEVYVRIFVYLFIILRPLSTSSSLPPQQPSNVNAQKRGYPCIFNSNIKRSFKLIFVSRKVSCCEGVKTAFNQTKRTSGKRGRRSTN